MHIILNLYTAPHQAETIKLDSDFCSPQSEHRPQPDHPMNIVWLAWFYLLDLLDFGFLPAPH